MPFANTIATTAHILVNAAYYAQVDFLNINTSSFRRIAGGKF